MILATVSALMAVAACNVPPQKHPKAPPVLQGAVSSVDGSIIVLYAKGAGTPNGRQVDISSAVFEGPDGQPVPRFPLRVNDVVIVVVDPGAPTEYRPKAQPGHPMPMFVRLLPLKAMVVERLVHAPDPTSIKP